MSFSRYSGRLRRILARQGMYPRIGDACDSRDVAKKAQLLFTPDAMEPERPFRNEGAPLGDMDCR